MKHPGFVVISIIIILFQIQALQAQTTGFTYQGSLKDGVSAANGNYDFEFALFSALSGGSQLGSTISLPVVAVTNSVFAVTLNFGNQFPGASRFLEIRVRPTGGGTFTTLTPRQPVNSGPYSVQSINATQLGGLAANQYLLSGAAIISAATQFNIGTERVFSIGGTSNTFVGVDTGNANTTGSQNSFFGGAAGSANTTGTFNSFFGLAAGRFNTTGSDNSFFGRGSGFQNTTGIQNSAFGRSAGLSNETGNNNSFFGFEAGRLSNTDNNSFFGVQAGTASTGINNSFFGFQAGLATSSGTNNSFFGVITGDSNTTGADNSFFGRSAGGNNTTGTQNSFFGRNTGLGNVTGNNNTAIGYGANISADGLSFATAIGSNATVSSSNTVVVGRSSDQVRVPGDLSVTSMDVGSELTISGSDSSGHIITISNDALSDNGDLLRLRIKAFVNATQTNNYITFVRSDNVALGAIQGNDNGGVEYLTSGSDYAEYLPRLNRAEPIQAGDIVGLFDGRITRKTTGAAKVMVVSTSPSVVGNYPGNEARPLYEKVAFLGQVHVRVGGVVTAGDFVMNSGLNDGTGIAVSADRITPEQFERVVGQAWESSSDPGIKQVRTAVGLIQHDPTVGRLISSNQIQAARISALEDRLASFEAKLEDHTSRLRSTAKGRRTHALNDVNARKRGRPKKRQQSASRSAAEMN